ncbi:hypothetical protein Q8A67_010508 [Cirrhinus molitorella]|uniref:SEFIR domain-containing protein n=1 Tax=Cirrhinus molitorella TaxID=172907 RepID=A0AA88PPZ1_9TELE|nr:hypothetical protein Q8A67_010508 [Cirrhinus molitorella]
MFATALERKTDQHKGSGSSLLRLSPQRSPVRGVHPGVLCAGYDHGAVRCHSQLSLLDRANYHHPVDLPDTTGLSWREGSIRSLNGTWIKLIAESESNYRCEYQPSFTSKQISLTGQEQLWFSFTVPNTSVCPSANHYISAYNIPPPSNGENGNYVKLAQTVQWNADIYAVLNEDKIVVTFNTSLVVDRHTIQLSNRKEPLKRTEGKGECKVEKCEVELEYMEYMGPCEDLMIWIKPKHCKDENDWKHQEVVCTNSSSLAIGVGCALTLLVVLLCCCIIYQIKRVGGSKRAASVRVLVVYPAVDTVFQHSVLLLAKSLQSHGDVSVVIDMWETGSLAKQGPLRWLNTQADLAERVLILSPPQHTQTGNKIKPKHCQDEYDWKHQELVCTNSSGLAIGVGCALTFLVILLCCCIVYQIIKRVGGSKRAVSVRVLVVYPAVDTVFQRSVLLLAESLQSHGDVSVVLDMWETGSLAKQGPLRWLNTQADLAERVLIISPPRHTQTDDLKSKLVPSMPDDTVSASASNLFALALNLVTSAAHDPHGRDKFWVINLDHDEKCVHTELRGHRMFVLPKDMKKLYQQLLSGVVKSPAPARCFRSFISKNALEINTDFPSCTKSVNPV